MDVIDYSPARRVLAVTRGHPYDRNAFADLFVGLDDTDVCIVEQPLAQECFRPEIIRDFDAVLFYDMPGVDFSSSPGQARATEPPVEFRENLLRMLADGMGVLFMHHALAAWPAWDEYAEIIGGRFHYQSSTLHEKRWPDSGYRHKVTHTMSVVGDHPLTRGVPAEFEMTDELYLCPVFEEQLVPLLRSNYHFDSDHFYSAAEAVAGRLESRQGWQHPVGSSLVGWVKSWGKSPVVYLQGGDDAEALGNCQFGKLVHNALRWLSDGESRKWVAERSLRAGSH
ncbi:MAG: ThuA domain-containing protein [Pseudomonadales bacterium]